jgi:hypothetical protein
MIEVARARPEDRAPQRVHGWRTARHGARARWKHGALAMLRSADG